MNDAHGEISKQQIQSFELRGIYTDRLDAEDMHYQQTQFDITSSTSIGTSTETHSVSDLMENPLLDKDAIHGRQLLMNEQLQQTNQMLQLRLLDEVLLDPFDSNRVLITDKNTINV